MSLTTKSEKISLAAACLLPLIILGSILILRPFWGLMDDVTNVFHMMPIMAKTGVLHHAWVYGVGDIAWGMFRPTYPPMVYLIYAPGMATAPWVTFFWNAILVCALIYFYASVLSRVLRLPLVPLLLVCGAFFYGHDLLQHPSLQEKLVLLAGAGLTWHCWNRPRWRTLPFWLVAFLWISFGAAAKASFAIHYCVAIMAFVGAQSTLLKQGNKRAWLEIAAIGLIGLVMVAAFAYISSRGSYTRQYDGGKVIPHLKSMHGVLFLVPIGAWMLAAAFRWKEIWARPEQLLTLTGACAYLAVFLPWGIGGYIQSVITPVYAAMLIQLCLWYFGRLPKALWLLPLAAFALAITTYRSVVNFGRLHDLGTMVARAGEIKASGTEQLWAPCSEGSLSMDRFFTEAQAGISVKEWLPGMPVKGRTFLFDQAMCTFPGREVSPVGCEQPEILLTSSFSRSYRVVRCN